jgi:hypothetical protein
MPSGAASHRLSGILGFHATSSFGLKVLLYETSTDFCFRCFASGRLDTSTTLNTDYDLFLVINIWLDGKAVDVSSLAGLFDSTAFRIRRLKPPVNGSTAKPSVYRPWRGFPRHPSVIPEPVVEHVETTGCQPMSAPITGCGNTANQTFFPISTGAGRLPSSPTTSSRHANRFRHNPFRYFRD